MGVSDEHLKHNKANEILVEASKKLGYPIARIPVSRAFLSSSSLTALTLTFLYSKILEDTNTTVDSAVSVALAARSKEESSLSSEMPLNEEPNSSSRLLSNDFSSLPRLRLVSLPLSQT